MHGYSSHISGTEVSHYTSIPLHALLTGLYGITHLILRFDLCLLFEIVERRLLYSTISCIIDWCVLSVLLTQMQVVVLVQRTASPMILWSMTWWTCTELHSTKTLGISYSIDPLIPQIILISSTFFIASVFYSLHRLIFADSSFWAIWCDLMDGPALSRRFNSWSPEVHSNPGHPMILKSSPLTSFLPTPPFLDWLWVDILNLFIQISRLLTRWLYQIFSI